MTRLPLSFALIPETMSRLAYFDGWPTDVLDRLALGAKLISVPKNGALASKGEPLDHLYVLVSGLVRLYIPLPNNMERVVALVHQGDSLGESCLVLNEACPFHAVACKDSHLLAIDPMVYRRELGRDSMLASKTLERVSKRLMETLRDTEICAQRSSVQRVACFLMRHRPTPEAATFTFQLPARKQDIAAKLGLTQETLSRVLSFMDKQGLIRMNGAKITIENGEKLIALTSMRDCGTQGENGFLDGDQKNL
jgi:CRP/FNR family transcriptional regulator, dissimilatory nitrate respiration regulator